jgi:hypothetical protein
MSYFRLSALESLQNRLMGLFTQSAGAPSSAMPSPTAWGKESDFTLLTPAKSLLIEKLLDQWHLVFEDLQGDAWYKNRGLKASQVAQWAALLGMYQEACEVLQPPAPWIEQHLNPLSASPNNGIHFHIHDVSIEACEAIQEALAYLHAVMQEIDTFLEAVGPSAQARQSAFYWAVALIIASVFAVLIVQAAEIAGAATALVSVLSACCIACLRLISLWYECDAAKTQVQWEKRQRHWHTLEKYLALFWWREMLKERRNDLIH